MKLGIRNREVKGISILDLSGRITLGEECNAIREEVKHLLRTDKKNILLNLANVTSIDSTGVGILVASFTSARAQGGALKLVNLTKKFQETLQVARLLTVFESFDNEAEALASFK